MAPPRAGGHTSGRVPTGRKGPVGLSDRATPMHCRSGSTLCAVKYMTKPSGAADTSGAQVRPFVAHGGSSGSGSVTSDCQVSRSGDVAIETLLLPSLGWVA